MPEEERKISPALVIIPVGLGLGLVGVLAALAWAAPPTPPPGRANLYGKVTDAETGSPIEGAAFSLNGLLVNTDSSGDYEFADLEPGDYTITAGADGYETKTDIMSLAEGNNQFDIQLNPIVVPPVSYFVYSGQMCGYTICPEAPAWYEPVYSVVITNEGASPETRTVTFYFRGIWDTYEISPYQESFEVTLQPGESYQYIFENSKPGPGGYVKIAFGHGVTVWMHVEDDLGGGTDEFSVFAP